MPNPTRQSAALLELVGELGAYPAQSADAQALVAWASERLQTVLAANDVAEPPARYCARCRRDIATELGRQAFLN